MHKTSFFAEALFRHQQVSGEYKNTDREDHIIVFVKWTAPRDVARFMTTYNTYTSHILHYYDYHIFIKVE